MKKWLVLALAVIVTVLAVTGCSPAANVQLNTSSIMAFQRTPIPIPNVSVACKVELLAGAEAQTVFDGSIPITYFFIDPHTYDAHVPDGSYDGFKITVTGVVVDTTTTTFETPAVITASFSSPLVIADGAVTNLYLTCQSYSITWTNGSNVSGNFTLTCPDLVS